MITIPAGARILLATRPIDFRNYGERRIMRSLLGACNYRLLISMI
jgi:hypothetical protein